MRAHMHLCLLKLGEAGAGDSTFLHVCYLPHETAWAAVKKEAVGWLYMSQRKHVITFTLPDRELLCDGQNNCKSSKKKGSKEKGSLQIQEDEHLQNPHAHQVFLTYSFWLSALWRSYDLSQNTKGLSCAQMHAKVTSPSLCPSGQAIDRLHIK